MSRALEREGPKVGLICPEWWSLATVNRDVELPFGSSTRHWTEPKKNVVRACTATVSVLLS